MRSRIPVTYEEFNPEWENLEVWEEDGKVQNEKYSRIRQLGRTGDKEEGEGLYRPIPHLIQELISPLLGNLENVEILRGSRNEEFLRAESSDHSLGGRSSTARIPGVGDKRKCNQLNTI